MYFKFKINARDLGGGQIKIDVISRKRHLDVKFDFKIFLIGSLRVLPVFNHIVTWSRDPIFTRVKKDTKYLNSPSSYHLIHPGHLVINVFFSYLYFFYFLFYQIIS